MDEGTFEKWDASLTCRRLSQAHWDLRILLATSEKVIDIPFGALLYSLEAENNPVAHDGLSGPQLEDRGALKILHGRIWNHAEPNDLRQNPPEVLGHRNRVLNAGAKHHEGWLDARN